MFLVDEDATTALAARLAPLIRQGDILALWGGLGVGKTVFARAFICARAGAAIEVPSPTFTLVQVYETSEADHPYRERGAIFHFDLFRLEAAEDALELGLEDALVDGISLIEWPDRLGPFLPAHRLDVTLAEVPGMPAARKLTLTGQGDWQQRLAEVALD